MMLVMAVNILSKRTTSLARAKKYRQYLACWLQGLQEIHHSKYSHRTNIHMAFHIYDFLKLFGPVYSWWCFPFERLIGHLQRLPHNDKSGKCLFPLDHDSSAHSAIGEAEATMLHSFLRAAKLRRWIRRPDCPASLLQVKMFFEKAFGGASIDPGPASEEPEGTSGEATMHCSSIPEDLREAMPEADRYNAVVVARYEHGGVIFARSSTHLGNSLIRYCTADGREDFGSIKYIYKSGRDVKFAVQHHLPAHGDDPFSSYKDFPATIRSPQLSVTLECITPTQVICHFARWTISSGTVAVLPLYKVCPFIILIEA